VTSDAHLWDRFSIQSTRHYGAADAYQVVFELRNPAARNSAGKPATVILCADGELILRFQAPDLGMPGLGRDDYLQKASAVVKAMSARQRGAASPSPRAS
jgi:hypothetical protein